MARYFHFRQEGSEDGPVHRVIVKDMATHSAILRAVAGKLQVVQACMSVLSIRLLKLLSPVLSQLPLGTFVFRDPNGRIQETLSANDAVCSPPAA